MIKISLLILLLCSVFINCDVNLFGPDDVDANMNNVIQRKMLIDGYCAYFIVLDSHEYIMLGNGRKYGGAVSIVHNENCRTCENK